MNLCCGIKLKLVRSQEWAISMLPLWATTRAQGWWRWGWSSGTRWWMESTPWRCWANPAGPTGVAWGTWSSRALLSLPRRRTGWRSRTCRWRLISGISSRSYFLVLVISFCLLGCKWSAFSPMRKPVLILRWPNLLAPTGALYVMVRYYTLYSNIQLLNFLSAHGDFHLSQSHRATRVAPNQYMINAHCWFWLMLIDADLFWLTLIESQKSDTPCRDLLARLLLWEEHWTRGGEVLQPAAGQDHPQGHEQVHVHHLPLVCLHQKSTLILGKGTTAWWLASLLKSLEPLATLSKTTSMCKSLLLIELIRVTSKLNVLSTKKKKNDVKCLFNVHHFLPSGLLATWTLTFSPSSSSLVIKPYFCYKCIVFIQS